MVVLCPPSSQPRFAGVDPNISAHSCGQIWEAEKQEVVGRETVRADGGRSELECWIWGYACRNGRRPPAMMRRGGGDGP